MPRCASLLPALLVGLAVAGCAAPAPAPDGVHLERILVEADYSNSEMPDVEPSVEMIRRGVAWRRAITTYAPSTLRFVVPIPAGARLDLAFSIEPGSAPVTFRVAVEDGNREVVFEGPLEQAQEWVLRSVDLASYSGREVTLALEAESESPGAAAYWGTPILSGSEVDARPNVILYIIDAAGADFMSLYGHEPATTPFLTELAQQGVVFERAYSNSTWTKISTPSFLTSLQSSAFGGYSSQEDVLPEDIETLPQLLHAAGYTTAELTTNPFAGTMTGLDRGLDYMRDSGVARNAVSSVELHANFLQWRQGNRARPFWAHFQTTDVHWPWDPEPPYLGTFTSAEERERFYADEERLAAEIGLARPQWLHGWRYPQEAFDALGIDRREFFDVADRLYDESMLHNDAQLRHLVERLQATGDWQNTLLIVASDHSSAHGLGLQEIVPDRNGPIMNSMRTRIPLVVVWPGRIDGARRVESPVSMVDVLPTVLELTGQPTPDVVQGHSFAPLLLGQAWEPAPVTLDEMNVNADGSVEGWLEVIDGRWGASWRFRNRNSGDVVVAGEVRLCDLPADPLCALDVASANRAVVDAMVPLLQERWEAAWILSARYSRGDGGEMSEEQRRTLRALGYIQ